MTRTWPTDAPDPHERPYRLFTLDHSEQAAAARFKDRFGRQPDWIVEHLGYLYVGPIPEGGNA